MAGKFYAVKKGRKPGIYFNWDDCKRQTFGFPGAVYKSFKTKEEAKDFLNPSENEKLLIDEHTLIAYVDGSFDAAVGQFSYGMVMLYEEKERYYAKKFQDEELAVMRNVAGEIKGSEAAMKYAIEHRFSKIAIYYDYAGIEKWPLGEWKTNKKGTKAYKAFYDEQKDKLQVKFVKVKGHSNDKYNDIADQLAKSALGIGDGTFVKKSGNEWERKIK